PDEAGALRGLRTTRRASGLPARAALLRSLRLLQACRHPPGSRELHRGAPLARPQDGGDGRPASPPAAPAQERDRGRTMNNSLNTVLDAISDALRHDILPNLDDPFARSQAIAVIDVIGNLKPV